MNIEGTLHEQAQDVDVDWLLVEIVRAQADRADSILLVQLPRHDDDLGMGRDLEHLEQAGESLGHSFGVRGQAQVLQHDCRLVATQRRKRGVAIRSGDHIVFVEAPLELLLQARVVFNDEQFGLVLGHSSPAATGAHTASPSLAAAR